MPGGPLTATDCRRETQNEARPCMFVRKAESQGLARDVSTAHVRSLRSCGAEKPSPPEAGFPEATADRGMCGCEGVRPSPGQGMREGRRPEHPPPHQRTWGRGKLNGRWRAGSAEPCPAARRPAPCPARGRGRGRTARKTPNRNCCGAECGTRAFIYVDGPTKAAHERAQVAAG